MGRGIEIDYLDNDYKGGNVKLNAFDIDKVYALIDAYKSGRLGGEKMPEDENPGLEKSSAQNYMYFTLPMALNYQRNSYVLWECANRMYKDENAKKVFDSAEVSLMSEELLRK